MRPSRVSPSASETGGSGNASSTRPLPRSCCRTISITGHDETDPSSTSCSWSSWRRSPEAWPLYFGYSRLHEAYKGYAAPEVFVDIPQGAGPASIGQRLVEAGVVRDTMTFRAAV